MIPPKIDTSDEAVRRVIHALERMSREVAIRDEIGEAAATLRALLAERQDLIADADNDGGHLQALKTGMAAIKSLFEKAGVDKMLPWPQWIAAAESCLAERRAPLSDSVELQKLHEAVVNAALRTDDPHGWDYAEAAFTAALTRSLAVADASAQGCGQLSAPRPSPEPGNREAGPASSMSELAASLDLQLGHALERAEAAERSLATAREEAIIARNFARSVSLLEPPGAPPSAGPRQEAGMK